MTSVDCAHAMQSVQTRVTDDVTELPTYVCSVVFSEWLHVHVEKITREMGEVRTSLKKLVST